MERFYFVADWGNQNYLFVKNIMASVAAFWHNGFHINKMKFANTLKRLFIDSGGFSMFTKYAEFPYSVSNYIEFVNDLRDKWPVTEVATMDYPCEPEVNRSSHKTNVERIDATINNALECIDHDTSIPWVPVLQGYTLDEYKYCWDQYQEFGVSANLWAVGSVCVRKKTGGIRYLMTRIKRYTKQNLHSFGLTLSSLRHSDVFFSIVSSDSAAWNWRISGENMRERKKNAVMKYHTKIEQLIESFSGQMPLSAFCSEV